VGHATRAMERAVASAGVQEQGCRLLRLLLGHPPTARVVVDACGPGHVRRAMDAHPSHGGVQAQVRVARSLAAPAVPAAAARRTPAYSVACE
jgi:hypothetical protein